MRILITSGIFPNPLDRSRGTFILKQAQALSERCAVSVVAPVAHVPWFGRKGPYPGRTALPNSATFEGLSVRYPRYTILPRIFRGRHSASVVTSTRPVMRELVEEFRPDVLVSFFAYPYGHAAVRLGHEFGLPVVVGLLGSDINIKAQRSEEGRLIRATLRDADAIWSVCQDLDDKAVAMGADPSRTRVIPNGIDPAQLPVIDSAEARRRLEIDPDDTLVCCVSRLSHEKGIDILLDAFARLRHTEAKLVVVGGGQDRSVIEAHIRQHQLERRVTLVGARPHEEVPFWICASQLCVLPSRMEGHPNAVLEALACGRPVVASRVGGVPDTITSDTLGRVVPPEDPEALSDAIDTALETQWDAKAIAVHGRRRTWGDVADEILVELESLVGRTQTPPTTHANRGES